MGDDLTERLRNSRFGRDVFGPKIAQPAARWLSANFPAEVHADPVDLGPVRADAGTVGAPAAAQAGVAGHADRVAQAVGDALAPSPDLVQGNDPVLGAVDAATALAASQVTAPDVAPDTEEATDLDLAPRSFAEVKALAKGLADRIKEHNLVVVAAGIAFWALLAIPATLFAVVSIAGLVLDPATVTEQVERNLNGLPEEAQTIISDQLEGVSGGSTGGLIAGVVFGLLLAFWTASGAMAKLMAALNTIYDANESRNFAELRGTAVALTFGGILFISSAIFLLAALPPILASVDRIGPSAATLFTWLRFPVLALVMVVALSLLYHFGPDRRTPYRPVTLGATVAMVLWIGLSALFTIYTSSFATYNETYGSIGGIVILLLWLFITSFVVLIGGELHAQRELDIGRSS